MLTPQSIIIRSAIVPLVKAFEGEQTLMEAAQRFGVQLRRARCSGFYQKTGDLAREAVNCNAWLDGN